MLTGRAPARVERLHQPRFLLAVDNHFPTRQTEFIGRRHHQCGFGGEGVSHIIGGRPVDADMNRCISDVFDLYVFTEHELLETVPDRRRERTRDGHEQGVTALEHVHVGDHPPLRCQERSVANAARRQSFDVVRQKVVKVRAAILSADPQPSDILPLQPAGTGVERFVFLRVQGFSIQTSAFRVILQSCPLSAIVPLHCSRS